MSRGGVMVGFVGLGTMGGWMAANVQKAGFKDSAMVARLFDENRSLIPFANETVMAKYSMFAAEKASKAANSSLKTAAASRTQAERLLLAPSSL